MEKIPVHYEKLEHPCFPQPEPAAKLWRYMSLAKLVSLLDTRCLHFARSDQLGDPFEGSWARNQPTRNSLDTRWRPIEPEVAAKMRKLEWQILRESMAINCWHRSDWESAAMWSQYANAGIAIQTTFAGLTAALPQESGDSKNSHHVFVGLVKYIDYESASVPEGNVYWPFMHKRESFSHEREVRAVIFRTKDGMAQASEDTHRDTGLGFQSDGVHVPVDLESLVSLVYVSPASPVWFVDAVRSVLVRFGIEVDVNHSTLDASPIY